MVFQVKNGVDVEKTVADTQFKIATNSKLFSILSDSIYTKKIDAVVRELCCNAFDAQIEAKQNRLFQVTLPDAFVPEFKVRDFGLGLSDFDMQMYTTYGESTKSGSNAYIGAFGIGAKSPFAYTNIFNVTSYHGGMARSYSMFVETGVPRMTLLGEAESSEPTGLEVFFSVSVNDIDEFLEKIIDICALMHDKIEFMNASSSWLERFKLKVAEYKWEPAFYLGEGYSTSNLEVDVDPDKDILYIVQGNVAYEMHVHEVIEMLKFTLKSDYKKITNSIGGDFYIVGTLKVPNGTFVPHPSRERLTFDELTKASLKVIFEKIYKYYIVEAVDRVLNGVNSYYELHNRLKGYGKLIAKTPRILEFTLPWSNYRLPTIKNFDDWEKTEFGALRIDKGEKGYRFKTIKLTMYGEKIDRIYYSSKFPIPENLRYRIIFDNKKSESDKAVILSGNANYLFTESDIAKFIDIQALRKLTVQELLQFKKSVSVASGNPRATKEKMSYLVISTNYNRFPILLQATVTEILGYAVNHPVYWIGSNRRYEIEMAGTIYNLKTKGDLQIFRSYFDCILDRVRVENNMPEKDEVKIGVAVLPEGNELRDFFTNLIEVFKETISLTVKRFLNETFFELGLRSGDLLFDTLLNKQFDLFLELIKGSPFASFFTEWLAAGKPKVVDKVYRYKMPFNLLSNGESLQKQYNSNRNILNIQINDMYSYLAAHGYPLLAKWQWWESDKEVVNELIFYLKEKNNQLVHLNGGGNYS